jgi:translation initiation factor 2 alpha subunit (eIF-2alpha)
MARIVKVEDNGAICELMEYNNLHAYMPVSQFSRRRVRSIRQVAKAGNEEILQVLNVDPTSGAVDLSKKRLEKEQVKKAEVYFRKSKKCHNMLKRIAEVCNTDVGNVYSSFGWDLYDSECHPLDLMEKSLLDKSIWNKFEIPENMKFELIKVVEKRIKLVPQKYEMDVSICCYDENGVDNLQKVFEEFENCCDNDVKLVIKSSPTYTLSCNSIFPKKATQCLENNAENLEKICKNYECVYMKIEEPHVA